MRVSLLTLVERVTRWTRIIKLPARQASEVNKALARETRRLWIKSLTLDNGTEFHGSKEMQQRLCLYHTPPYKLRNACMLCHNNP